jgi:hypothetical protein
MSERKPGEPKPGPKSDDVQKQGDTRETSDDKRKEDNN